MSFPLLISCAFLCLTAMNCAPSEQRCGPSEGLVARVLDGDTIELQSGEKIRYLMIDTPEISHNASEVAECFADQASELNRELVAGKTVSLRYDTECSDRYGRLLAYVSIGDREINTLLVERGFACMLFIPPNGNDRKSEFQSLESRAKVQKKGLWGACESNPC